MSPSVLAHACLCRGTFSSIHFIMAVAAFKRFFSSQVRSSAAACPLSPQRDCSLQCAEASLWELPERLVLNGVHVQFQKLLVGCFPLTCNWPSLTSEWLFDHHSMCLQRVIICKPDLLSKDSYKSADVLPLRPTLLCSPPVWGQNVWHLMLIRGAKRSCSPSLTLIQTYCSFFFSLSLSISFSSACVSSP